MKGLVDGKPINKMLVDGGASVNLMPYTTFRKLGKGPEDLMKTDMMFKDFGGNTSKTRGAINVELTIGSKTLLTTFFVIDRKGSYSFVGAECDQLVNICSFAIRCDRMWPSTQ